MAGDNNPTMRSAMARQLANITARTFTSSFSISGQTAVSAYIGALDESDQLEIAGRDRVRGIVVGMPVTAIAAWSYDEGWPVVLDADDNWIVRRWRFSPDGAEILFTLLTSD